MALRYFTMDRLFMFAVFMCMSFAQEEGDEATFQIKIEPEESSLILQVGENKFFSCFGSDQSSELKWFKDDVELTEKDPTKRVYTTKKGRYYELHLTSVEKQDVGQYRCEGTLGPAKDSKSFTITVKVAIKVFSPDSQFGIVAKDAWIKCEHEGSPTPDLTWERPGPNGQNVEIKSGDSNRRIIIMNNSTLKIKDLELGDQGVYICDLTTRKVGDTKVFRIDFEVVEPPKLVQPPTIEPQNAAVGEKVEIHCEATGKPLPEYNFFKDGIPVAETQVDKKKGKLIFDKLKREDEGNYECRAINRGGTDKNTVFLDVRIPPKVFPIDNQTAVPETKNIKVTCKAEGDPAPEVTWIKEGMNQPYNDGVQVDGPTFEEETMGDPTDPIKTVIKRMIFSSVQAQDGSTYTCTAKNSVGTASQVFRLGVLYKPHFNTGYDVDKFYGWRGHTTNMTCLLSANEVVAEVKWYRTGPTGNWIEVSGRAYQVQSPRVYREHSLTSSSLEVKINDEPLYQNFLCSATNSQGTGNRTVKLVEAKTPGAPKVQSTRILSSKIILSVELPDVNGGQEVTDYKYYFYEGSNEPLTPNTMSIKSKGQTTALEIEGLKASTEYTVVVMAKNAVGAGQSDIEKVTTMEVSVPVRVTLKSGNESPEPNSYTVQWDIPNDNGSPIEHYKLQYQQVTVNGNSPDQWTVESTVGGEEERIVNRPSATKVTLTQLKRGAFYRLKIQAKNAEGYSTVEEKIFRTNQGVSSSRGGAGIIRSNINTLLVLLLLPLLLHSSLSTLLGACIHLW